MCAQICCLVDPTPIVVRGASLGQRDHTSANRVADLRLGDVGDVIVGNTTCHVFQCKRCALRVARFPCSEPRPDRSYGRGGARADLPPVTAHRQQLPRLTKVSKLSTQRDESTRIRIKTFAIPYVPSLRLPIFHVSQADRPSYSSSSSVAPLRVHVGDREAFRRRSAP